jgi:hypothetical protein
MDRAFALGVLVAVFPAFGLGWSACYLVGILTNACH